MHEYDNGLIAGFTFYDCVPYSQGRQGGDIRIRIGKPATNILSVLLPPTFCVSS